MVDERVLRHLAQHHATPVITLSVPTHRFGPETTQDRVVVSNMIDRLALDQDLRAWPDAEAALESVRREAALVDPRRTLDSVLLYGSAEASGHLALDVRVTPRAAVGTHIALGPVVQAVQNRARALVVDVSEAGARAWWMSGSTLSEIRDDSFPYEADPEDRLGQSRWDFGRERTAAEQTRRRRVVEHVATRVTALLAERPAPVFVGGNPKLVSLLAGDHRLDGHLSSHRLPTMNHADAAALTRTAQDIDGHLGRERQCVWTSALSAARDGRRLATDLDEITELVNDGNAASLVLDETSMPLDPEQRAVRLDHVIATMLARGDEVAVVDRTTLGVHGPHALITRY